MTQLLRFIPISVGLLLGMLPALVNAASFGSYDPRSLSMGGTGVSHANIDHAAYYNPALLSVAQDDDDFSLLIPTIGVRLYDPEDLLDALEAHQDGNYETAVDDAMDELDTATAGGVPSEIQTAAIEAADSTQRLLDSYVSISGKALDFEIHAGVGMAIPSKGLGMAVTGSGRVMGGVVLDITDSDRYWIQKYVDEMNYVAANPGLTNDTDVYVGGVPANGFINIQDQLTSTASIRGAMIIEGGLSLSHEFESLDNWSIGITPKTVQIETYDYKVSVQDSEIDEDKGKLSYDDINIDIGLAKRISEGWKVGFVVKNAIEKEYKTALGNTILLEPTARAGISHHTNWTTIALDVDLTENNSIGLTGEKTQYAAIGMEFDLALVQLRVGARHNLSAVEGQDANLMSVGVGLYVFGVHLDAAYAENEDEIAAAIQLGFQF